MLLRNTPFRTFLATAAACASIGLAGCPRNTMVASVPVSAPPQPTAERPMNVAPDTDASPPHAAAPAAPHIAGDVTQPPVLDDLSAMKMPSAPPRPPAEKSADHEPEPVDHGTAPQIVPQLSPSDQQNYERQASSDVSVAQQNLAEAQKHQLDAQQRSWRDSVKSYIQDSQDAGKRGDWAAAQRLAEKARLTSIQLLTSL